MGKLTLQAIKAKIAEKINSGKQENGANDLSQLQIDFIYESLMPSAPRSYIEYNEAKFFQILKERCGCLDNVKIAENVLYLGVLPEVLPENAKKDLNAIVESFFIQTENKAFKNGILLIPAKLNQSDWVGVLVKLQEGKIIEVKYCNPKGAGQLAENPTLKKQLSYGNDRDPEDVTPHFEQKIGNISGSTTIENLFTLASPLSESPASVDVGLKFANRIEKHHQVLRIITDVFKNIENQKLVFKNFNDQYPGRPELGFIFLKSFLEEQLEDSEILEKEDCEKQSIKEKITNNKNIPKAEDETLGNAITQAKEKFDKLGKRIEDEISEDVRIIKAVLEVAIQKIRENKNFKIDDFFKEQKEKYPNAVKYNARLKELRKTWKEPSYVSLADPLEVSFRSEIHGILKNNNNTLETLKKYHNTIRSHQEIIEQNDSLEKLRKDWGKYQKYLDKKTSNVGSKPINIPKSDLELKKIFVSEVCEILKNEDGKTENTLRKFRHKVFNHESKVVIEKIRQDSLGDRLWKFICEIFEIKSPEYVKAKGDIIREKSRLKFFKSGASSNSSAESEVSENQNDASILFAGNVTDVKESWNRTNLMIKINDQQYTKNSKPQEFLKPLTNSVAPELVNFIQNYAHSSREYPGFLDMGLETLRNKILSNKTGYSCKIEDYTEEVVFKTREGGSVDMITIVTMNQCRTKEGNIKNENQHQSLFKFTSTINIVYLQDKNQIALNKSEETFENLSSEDEKSQKYIQMLLGESLPTQKVEKSQPLAIFENAKEELDCVVKIVMS